MALIALSVALIVPGDSRGASSRCVVVTGASSTGGATLTACGKDARQLCHEAVARRDPLSARIEQSCRKAGFG